MTTSKPMAATLAEIMGSVGPIEKRGQIKGFGSGPSYPFARDVDVMAAVTPKMSKAGIIMVPERVEQLPTTLTMSEKQFIANIKTSWLVTDGTDEIRFETFGQGADSGDKALPKAQSNARKYAFFMLYHIVTGDDPDQWASPHDQPDRSERATDAGRRSGGKPATTSGPVQRTPEEQALLDELAALPGMTTARMSLLADAVGVEKGTRANADQLRAMIARATQPGVPSPADTPEDDGTSPVDPATAQPGNSPASAAPAPTDAQILAAAGEGAEIVDEPAVSPELQERINKARAKGKKAEPEQESLAAALGSPVESE